MIRSFFSYIVTNFGFDGLSDFNDSLIHSKYLLLTIPLSLISAYIETILGIHSFTLLAFVLLVILELMTGLISSKVRGIKLESKKFGRFGLKIFVWLSLILIINSLRLEYEKHTDSAGELAYSLFNWLHTFLFIYINLEYLISILENLGHITGNKSMSNGLIDMIKKTFNLGSQKKKKS